MYAVRAVTLALAALMFACSLAAADKKAPAAKKQAAAKAPSAAMLAEEAERKQAEAEHLRAEEEKRREQQERQRAEAEASKRREAEQQRLEALGYVLLKPFRDCDDCPEMVPLPSGRFDMGSAATEAGHYSAEGPQHRVDFATPFALGRTEVTQGQWRALMGANPSQFSACGDACPVEQVSWNDAQEYVQRLSKKTGKRYRLPSEAEWEYAARAGMTTPFNTGNCIHSDEANFNGSVDYNYCYTGTRNYRRKTLPVASFAANGFGLYDMHGNVWEWVEDCWHDNYEGAPADGHAWISGACDKRILRGGSWNVEARVLRSAERNWEWQGEHGNSQGFRVARTLF